MEIEMNRASNILDTQKEGYDFLKNLDIPGDNNLDDDLPSKLQIKANYSSQMLNGQSLQPLENQQEHQILMRKSLATQQYTVFQFDPIIRKKPVEIQLVQQTQTEPAKKQNQQSQCIVQCITIASLILGTLPGTLIRIYSAKLFLSISLTQLLGIVFKDLPANMFGCFIIGIFAPYKAEFSKTIPTLNLLVMTALCGSITTWSSWNITLSQMFLKNLILEAIFALLIGFATSCAFFQLGVQLNELVLPIAKLQKPVNEVILLVLYVTLIVFFFLALLLFYLVNHWDSKPVITVYISLLIGPFGTILRWLLQSKLNGLHWMPIGTLISNILAVIIVAIVRRVILVNLDIAHLLQSIIDGFCGDLSTVSSWAAEMHTIKPIAHKWAYALLSFILSQMFGLLILKINNEIEYP